MWHRTALVAGALLAVSTAAYLIPAAGSQAQSASFDSRWLPIDPAQKSDRIDAPWNTAHGLIYFFDLPTVQTTVAVKALRKSSDAPATESYGAGRDDTDEVIYQPRSGSIRQTPIVPVRVVPRDRKQNEKLPVGCESSFSPVATPVMANVVGRCLS